jgi:E1A/CREB-binding protein
MNEQNGAPEPKPAPLPLPLPLNDEVKNECLEVLKVLQQHTYGWLFISPVDPVTLGIPNYFDIIKQPMDLGTIKEKLIRGDYHSIEAFQADVFRTFDNALTYNGEDSDVGKVAEELKQTFKTMLK